MRTCRGGWTLVLAAMLAASQPMKAQAPSAAAAAPAVAASGEDALRRARTALEQDKPDEALKILKALAAQQPPVKGVQRELGLVYYRTGKLQEANGAFARAISEDAGDREAVQLEGLTLYRLGKQAEAIPYLEKVRQWMPAANTDATYVLGLCYLNARRYDDARAAFASQFGLVADAPGAHLLLATMLRHAGLPELAAVEAQKAVNAAPALPMAHFTLGEIALYKSDVPRAIRELEAEEALNPNFAPTYERLGDAYLRAGRVDDSQQAVTKAIALDTTLTGAYLLMGKVLLRKQDTQTAILYLEHAEKMDASDFTVHVLLSRAFHQVGREDDARRESALASSLRGDSQPKQRAPR